MATRGLERAAKEIYAERLRSFRLELVLDPAVSGMFPVLDFDPVPEPAAAVGALAVLRHHAFQPHQAGVPEQVRADLALLEIAQEDAVDTRASRRARLTLRMLSGSRRRSSPLLTRISKA